MRPYLVASAVAALVLGFGLCAGPPPVHAQGGRALEPLYGPAEPLYRREAPSRRDGGIEQRRAAPRQLYAPSRPRIICDPYNRCWREGYGAPGGYGASRGYGYTTRPPGWADDLPGRLQQPDRFFRPRSGVVCDQSTSLCYKNNRVDKSETQDVFGARAGDRADDLRDDRGSGRVFVPERGVTCDTAQQACYDGRFKDFSLTRRYFGREAADRLN